MIHSTGQQQNEAELPWAWIKRVRDLVSDPTPPIKPTPVEILPWLYLSDERSVRDTSKLVRLGISHVLTVNSMSFRFVSELRENLMCRGITHMYSPGQDYEGYVMIGNHWEECRLFLEHVRESGGIAVVHCSAGINRSAVIVAAAHMVLEQIPVLQAVEHCVEQRGCVLWNRSFQKQLCILAKQENLLGAKPEGYCGDPIEDPILPPPPPTALDHLT